MIEFLDNALFSLAWPWPLVIIVASMALLAVFAFLRKTLTPTGAAAAYILGVIVLWTLHFGGLLLLAIFFVGANVVGRVSRRINRNTKGEDTIIKKGSTRDHMQVLANGLMAIIGGLIWYYTSNISALVMFGAAVAEATSDTFAGEIGRLSKQNPISIWTLQPVPKGLSGGVTVLGTVAAFISSLFIAFCWAVFFDVQRPIACASIICLTGFVGCIIDSYLGACAQAHYLDPETGIPTEHEEKNGKKLDLIRGIRWIDNDMVNLMSNIFSAVFALGMTAILF